jgi:hypothetical protein
MIPRLFSPARCLAVMMTAAASGCGGDLTLPGGSSTSFELSIVGGNGQTGTVGQELPQPLVVKLQGDGGAPLSGRHVAFVSSDPSTTLDPDTAVTNSQGEAVANWILGTAPGPYQAEARLVLADASEPPTAQFAASAIAGAADTMRAISPLAQPGRWDEHLDLVVIVVDRFGNPVPNVVVEWKVESGKGEVSQSETGTGADGTASVVWTLGRRLGVQVVSARVKEGDVSGSPIIFTATVLF